MKIELIDVFLAAAFVLCLALAAPIVFAVLIESYRIPARAWNGEPWDGKPRIEQVEAEHHP